MIKNGWRFITESIKPCTAITDRYQRPCHNLAKWFRREDHLCPAHAKQRAKQESLNVPQQLADSDQEEATG